VAFGWRILKLDDKCYGCWMHFVCDEVVGPVRSMDDKCCGCWMHFVCDEVVGPVRSKSALSAHPCSSIWWSEMNYNYKNGMESEYLEGKLLDRICFVGHVKCLASMCNSRPGLKTWLGHPQMLCWAAYPVSVRAVHAQCTWRLMAVEDCWERN